MVAEIRKVKFIVVNKMHCYVNIVYLRGNEQVSNHYIVHEIEYLIFLDKRIMNRQTDDLIVICHRQTI